MEIILQVKMDPSTGGLAVGVNPPEAAGNMVILMGMLEMTKIALTKQLAENERRVQPVSMMPPGFPGT